MRACMHAWVGGVSKCECEQVSEVGRGQYRTRTHS